MADTLLHKETPQSVLKALLYYDIFHYPLTFTEVYHSMSTNHVTTEQVKETLNTLSAKGYIFQQDKFYSIDSNKELITRRVNGNLEAERWMSPAQQQAQLIYSFPFVRAVMASGSLSKNYMDESSDLDFFIVTSPNRLWLARTLLVLYKKLILSNSHKLFCVNYFIDSNHLEIEEKNIFTATELATLIPFSGHRYYKKLMNENQWIKEYLPNHQLRLTPDIDFTSNRVKRTIETIINFLGAGLADRMLMSLTNLRWKRLYGGKYSAEDFKIAFKTERHVSKNHPRFYQKKVVNHYSDKLKHFARKFGIEWIHD